MSQKYEILDFRGFIKFGVFGWPDMAKKLRKHKVKEVKKSKKSEVTEVEQVRQDVTVLNVSWG